jgi:hypothetical protein
VLTHPAKEEKPTGCCLRIPRRYRPAPGTGAGALGRTSPFCYRSATTPGPTGPNQEHLVSLAILVRRRSWLLLVALRWVLERIRNQGSPGLNAMTQPTELMRTFPAALAPRPPSPTSRRARLTAGPPQSAAFVADRKRLSRHRPGDTASTIATREPDRGAVVSSRAGGCVRRAP